MFRINLPHLFKVKKPAQKQGKPSPIVKIKESGNEAPKADLDWKQDLDQLVVDNLKRKDAQLEIQHATQQGLPVQALLDEKALPKEEKEQQKRTTDGTVNDIKIWWGEALTPWNASMVRDLNSKKETPTTKAHKRWFGH
jgi:hypothetical protein